jgi:sugar transferase EpsL
MTKRILDVVVAAVALVVALPVMAVIAFVILATMGRPILFRQTRPGLHAKPFCFIKFRTMRPARSGTEQPADDAARVTPVGRWLRRYSLDELPQLFSVIKGDLSLVGPRPLLPEYLPLYSERQARRHDVRPGITGWAQVNGRNSLTWKERLDLDVWYVEHQSLWLDLRILLRTVVAVFGSANRKYDGSVAMEKFRGDQA